MLSHDLGQNRFFIAGYHHKPYFYSVNGIIMYPLLLQAHLALLLISLLSFVLRTFWAIKGSEYINNVLLFKIHKVLNLLLILSGLALCVTINQYPFIDGWVTEKFVLLFAYVGFAMLAFKPKMNLKLRQFCIGITMVFFVMIFYIAKTKVTLFI
ncbi:MAG: putative membrane protein SirB2 [Moritella dasanensis]